MCNSTFGTCQPRHAHGPNRMNGSRVATAGWHHKFTECDVLLCRSAPTSHAFSFVGNRAGMMHQHVAALVSAVTLKCHMALRQGWMGAATASHATVMECVLTRMQVHTEDGGLLGRLLDNWNDGLASCTLCLPGRARTGLSLGHRSRGFSMSPNAWAQALHSVLCALASCIHAPIGAGCALQWHGVQPKLHAYGRRVFWGCGCCVGGVCPWPFWPCRAAAWAPKP
jgi:hypothetical protein